MRVLSRLLPFKTLLMGDSTSTSMLGVYRQVILVHRSLSNMERRSTRIHLHGVESGTVVEEPMITAIRPNPMDLKDSKTPIVTSFRFAVMKKQTTLPGYFMLTARIIQI